MKRLSSRLRRCFFSFDERLFGCSSFDFISARSQAQAGANFGPEICKAGDVSWSSCSLGDLIAVWALGCWGFGFKGQVEHLGRLRLSSGLHCRTVGGPRAQLENQVPQDPSSEVAHARSRLNPRSALQLKPQHCITKRAEKKLRNVLVAFFEPLHLNAKSLQKEKHARLWIVDQSLRYAWCSPAAANVMLETYVQTATKHL